MLCLHFLLAGLTLLAPPPVSPDKTDADARETLRQVVAMTPLQQKAWLRELKARLDWANRLILSPEEAAKQRERINGLLQQKSVSLQTVLELIRQRNVREHDAVQRLVERYHSQVYQSFEGPGLTERKEAWYRVWEAWEAAGSPSDQRDRLMAWLDGGIRSSMPGKIGPLPADPTFTSREPPSKSARKKVTPPTATPAEALDQARELARPGEASKNAKKPAEAPKKPDNASGKPAEASKNPAETVKKPAEAVKKLDKLLEEATEVEKEPGKASDSPAEAEKALQQPAEPVKKPAEPSKKPKETSKQTAEPAKKPAEPAKKAKETTGKAAEPAKKPKEIPEKPPENPEPPADPEPPTNPEPPKTSQLSQPSVEEFAVAAASGAW